MIKRINFIWVILLFCLVFCETGLCQSQSEYALIRMPVYYDPLIWKWTSAEAWNQWGVQLFVNPVSAAQGYVMTPDYEPWSGVSFHLDHGWNRLLYQECLDNWIEAAGTRGSGTGQFLWPTSVDAHAPCGYWGGWQYSDFYYIFIADAVNNRIVKLRYHWGYQDMDWLGTITGGGLDLPEDLDINNGGTFVPTSDDYLWVLNGHQIKRFTTLDGVLRNTYGTYGCDGAVGHFCRPTAVVCGRSPWSYDPYANVNWLYVADDGNHRIVWLDKDPDLETITWIKSLSLPSDSRIVDLEVDNFGQVWAVDWDNGRIYKYTMDLYPLCYFGSWGTGENQFYYPVSLSNTGGYLGCNGVFIAEAWTDSSGGQYFAIGTDVLDFEVTSSVDYVWHYINYILVDPSHVTIQIYDEENQLIKTLFDAMELSGPCAHVWDGTDQSGDSVFPGDYRIVLIDSAGYEDLDTHEPTNVVTKEAWIHHEAPFGPPPVNLVAWQSGPDRVTLEWDSYLDRSLYVPHTIYCNGCLCGSVGPHVTTYVDSGLIPGRYIYWVKWYWEDFESPPSNADTVFLSPSGSFGSQEDFPIGNNVSNFWGISSKAGDTVELRVDAVTVYPGHFKEIRVSMMNPVRISGFNLLMKLSVNPNLVNFHTVNISQDSILIESDWVDYPVRECFIDTIGSLISNFNSLFARGQVADTTLPHCKYLWVKGWSDPDNFIEASGDFRLLFKFGVDVSCIPDADTTRSVLFDIPFGHFVKSLGNLAPLKYYPIGQLFAWWSVPGDANNDSAVNASDVVFLTNYLFVPGAPQPCIIEAADPDSSCSVNISDIIYLQNYLYQEGSPPPKPGCASAKKEENQPSTFSK